MSVLRQDATTKEWVIFASERSRRPHEFKKVPVALSEASSDPLCPFCPGKEAMTPPELTRYPAGGSSEWTVRVVPNKFPALHTDGEPHREEKGRLFREMAGVGHHEIVIETPEHHRPTPILPPADLHHVLRAYRDRYRVLRQDPRVRYVIIFKNHGEGAGTSLVHAHSQLVATPIAPMQIRRKYEVAVGHYDDTGRCLYCDLVDEELRARVRIVQETERYAVFHPYASRVPFETWIVPKVHQPSFGMLGDSETEELARVLSTQLRTIYTALGNPDFNYIIHTAPVEGEAHPYYLWHLQILPRLTMIAGFELGSGISINTVMPEESAAFIREWRN